VDKQPDPANLGTRSPSKAVAGSVTVMLMTASPHIER